MTFRPRLAPVPSAVSEPLRTYLQQLADAVNALPAFSTFSAATPESAVTASVPTIGINFASAHTRVWLKETGDGNTGWVSLVTA